jgi:sialidase-1
MTRARNVLLAGSMSVVVGMGLTSCASDAAPVASRVVYQEKAQGYNCFRIPAIIKAANGDLLAFAEGRNGGARFCADAGDIDLVLKRSTDGGRTWGDLQVIIKGTGNTRGNPAPILIPSTGRIVLLSTAECVEQARCGRIPQAQYSDDNGHTWTVPRVLTRELGFLSAPGWLATGPAHGLVLAHGPRAGRVLAGMSYTIGGRYTGAIVYSDDQGVTWRLGAADTSTDPGLAPQEINLVELTDGRIYAAARNQANHADQCLAGGTPNRAFALSIDGGAHFSHPFAFEPGLITPTVQGSVLGMNTTDASLLFAAPVQCGRRRELRIRVSRDQGRHWQSAQDGLLVWAEGAAYSDMVQLGASSVGVLYEAGPPDSPNASIRWSTVTER